MTDDVSIGDTGTARSSGTRGGVAGARIALAATTGLLTALDLALKAWARSGLTGGRVVELGIVDLRLAFNPGVAFSFGADLPTGVVLGVTGVVLAGLVVVAWRAAAGGPAGVRWALAVVLGGAVANFVDRATRGAVTDYLHTGWFPTFNLADVFITLGGVALVLASLRADRGRPAPTEGAA